MEKVPASKSRELLSSECTVYNCTGPTHPLHNTSWKWIPPSVVYLEVFRALMEGLRTWCCLVQSCKASDKTRCDIGLYNIRQVYHYCNNVIVKNDLYHITFLYIF